MKEQRKLKRRHLVFNLKMEDEKTGDVLGYLGDLTIEGLLILANNSIPLNKKYKIKLFLPTSDIFTKDSIIMTVKTMWRHEDINPDVLGAGCEILEIAPKDVTLINELIEFLGFND